MRTYLCILSFFARKTKKTALLRQSFYKLNPFSDAEARVRTSSEIFKQQYFLLNLNLDILILKVQMHQTLHLHRSMNHKGTLIQKE